MISTFANRATSKNHAWLHNAPLKKALHNKTWFGRINTGHHKTVSAHVNIRFYISAIILVPTNLVCQEPCNKLHLNQSSFVLIIWERWSTEVYGTKGRLHWGINKLRSGKKNRSGSTMLFQRFRRESHLSASELKAFSRTSSTSGETSGKKSP